MYRRRRKKKSPLRATRLVRQKRRARLFKFFFALFVFGLFFGGIVWVTHLPLLKIESVTVSGNSAVSVTEIQNLIKSKISGNHYYLFSKSNRFLYPKKEILNEVLTLFKRVETIKLEVNGNDLVVSITERKPKYVWCTGTPATRSKECYFVDDQGYIFAQAPRFSGSAYFLLYGQIKKNPISQYYLPQPEFEALTNFIRSVRDKDIIGSAIVSEGNGVFALHLEKGGKIIFKQDQDSTTLLSNLELLKKNTALFKAQAASAIEYIDLRFGNKVYYKTVGDKKVQIRE